MARRFAGIVLLGALVVSVAAPAGAGSIGSSPCDADASLCATAVDDAACVAVGAYAALPTPQAFSRSDTAVTSPAGYDHEAVHQVEGGFRTPATPLPGGPDVAVHVGEIESECVSYLFDGQTKSKACGTGELGDVIIDVNNPQPRVRILASHVTVTTCVASEPAPLPPLTTVEFGKLFISVGAGTFTVPASPPANTIIPIGAEGFIAINERWDTILPGCRQGAGSALRLVLGANSIILGWTSVSSCTP